MATFRAADANALAQLAWAVFDGARRACGKDDGLTMEMSNLHAVLESARSEMSNPGSRLNLTNSRRRTELERHMESCSAHLRNVDSILNKYNALTYEERSRKPLWTKIRFGNGEVHNLADIRLILLAYAKAIAMSLRSISVGSRGPIERHLSRQKGSLKGLCESVNIALAQMCSKLQNQSIMSTFWDDERTFWRTLRHELYKHGFPRSAILSKKDLILDYVKELDARGVLSDSKTGTKVEQQKAQYSPNSPREPNTTTFFQVADYNVPPQALEPDVYSDPRGPDSRFFYEPSYAPKEFPGKVFNEQEDPYLTNQFTTLKQQTIPLRNITPVSQNAETSSNPRESCPSLSMSSRRSSRSTSSEQDSLSEQYSIITPKNSSDSFDRSNPERPETPPSRQQPATPPQLSNPALDREIPQPTEDSSPQFFEIRRNDPERESYFQDVGYDTTETFPEYEPRYDEEYDPVIFRDPFDRPFTLPYSQARTFQVNTSFSSPTLPHPPQFSQPNKHQSLDTFIKSTCGSAARGPLGDEVQNGYYSIIDSWGRIIPAEEWEYVVEPGMQIGIQVWEAPKSLQEKKSRSQHKLKGAGGKAALPTLWDLLQSGLTEFQEVATTAPAQGHAGRSRKHKKSQPLLRFFTS
jgi:hypothetical protein